MLAGLIVEAVTGHSLDRELKRRIFWRLRLRDTYFPVNFPFLVGPHARGYSLDLDDELNPIEGPLLDFTVYNPSSIWAAGNIVSNEQRSRPVLPALLGGRLLSGALLAEMKRAVPVSAPGCGYGLGLYVLDTPCGTLVGHSRRGPRVRQLAVQQRGRVAPSRGDDQRGGSAGRGGRNVHARWLSSEGIREPCSGQPCAAGERRRRRTRYAAATQDLTITKEG